MNITVVDSMMGSGKSTWAFNFMSSHPDKRWWFITPYLSEIERTLDVCADLNFIQPENDAPRAGNNKSDHLIALIESGRNISCTHKLFLSIIQTPELLQIIQDQRYNLIIDETLDVLDPKIITKDDIAEKVAAGTIEIDPDTKEVKLNNPDYRGAYSELFGSLKYGKLFLPSDDSNALIWMYNPQIFDQFESIYILTYLFHGSRMNYYFQFNGIEFEEKNTDGRILLDADPTIMIQKEAIKNLLNIYDGHLNEIGARYRTEKYYSHNWYSTSRHDREIIQLFNNAYNYLHNIRRAKVGDTLYTTYKNIAKNDPLKSYKKAFLSCSQRATNEYSDRYNLAYLVNIYDNPAIIQFFSNHGIKYDQDPYALCSMIQWIWRSAIRKGEEVFIYIPSIRMRRLLKNWLESPK